MLGLSCTTQSITHSHGENQVIDVLLPEDIVDLESYIGSKKQIAVYVFYA